MKRVLFRKTGKKKKRRSMDRKTKYLLITAGAVLVICIGFLAFSLRPHTDRAAAVEDILENGIFRIGLRQDLYGMSILDETTGTFSGMEADVAAEVAKRLLMSEDFPVEIVPINTKSAAAALKDGDIDIALGCFIAEGKLSGVSYTEPYFTDAVVFLSGDGTAGDIPVVGIIRNTYAQVDDNLEKYYEERGEEMEIRIFGSCQDAIISFATGHIDMLAADSVMLTNYAFDYEMSAQNILQHGYCVMVNKNRPDLYSVVNGIIAEMAEDGTLDQYRAKWAWPDFDE